VKKIDPRILFVVPRKRDSLTPRELRYLEIMKRAAEIARAN
jgi:hypothetical protein